jgi:hypothetical protein
VVRGALAAVAALLWFGPCLAAQDLKPLGGIPEPPRVASYKGRVVVEGGAEPGRTVSVEAVCAHTEEPWHGYTDARGNFSFILRARSGSSEMSGETGIDVVGVCEVRASLAGFQVARLRIDRPRADLLLTLHPLLPGQGSTVSVQDLKAPPAARKAYDKGAAALTKRQWREAANRFQKAVAAYAEYASAWQGLGTALEAQNDRNRAREAYQ